MSGESSIRRDVAFGSEGAELTGWVYAPDSNPPWPLVVMAHGFSATRHMTAGKYAEAFRAAGLAVLLYDHRGFGDSGGEPRRQVNPWIQARGYRDAFSYARSLEGVDGSRLAIWGDSFSGGVALAVAGIDGGVAALVVQVPALGRESPPADPDGSLYRAFKETILSGAVEPSEGGILGPDTPTQARPLRIRRRITARRPGRVTGSPTPRSPSPRHTISLSSPLKPPASTHPCPRKPNLCLVT